MKRVGIILVLLVVGGIVVGFASPRDISTVTPRPPKPVSVSSAVAVPTCAVARFTHQGHPRGTYANEIIYDNGAVLSDSYRRVGPRPVEVTVPLNLNPGPHSVLIKVEVNGEITYLSDKMTVNCP
jgi:hypothetical protein